MSDNHPMYKAELLWPDLGTFWQPGGQVWSPSIGPLCVEAPRAGLGSRYPRSVPDVRQTKCMLSGALSISYQGPGFCQAHSGRCPCGSPSDNKVTLEGGTAAFIPGKDAHWTQVQHPDMMTQHWTLRVVPPQDFAVAVGIRRIIPATPRDCLPQSSAAWHLQWGRAKCSCLNLKSSPSSQ